MRAYGSNVSGESLDRYVVVRLARQELLLPEEGSQLFFILDESVLRRRVGGRGVMRAAAPTGGTRRARPQAVQRPAGGRPGLRRAGRTRRR
ncbi:Scr1 family TA system antitoxin-like transcriptional regulator [Streptomyces fuscichromogenes]|uniref:Scr1 family TA system antitoxin-like transcriptional regulator n=1 Tax=Streptomyces fuscichromogenes TaxID=1324013 RepID=UPI00380CF982